MTSSYRATGHASVRVTPSGASLLSGAWSPAELTLPVYVDRRTTDAAPVAPPPPDPAAVAAERAALIDEGYQRGLADGMRKAEAAARVQLEQAVSLVGNATAQLHEAGTLAPAVLEENLAALGVTIARQILAREASVSRELVADLVRRALTEFPIDQPVRIRVHPMDLSMLTAAAAAGAPITGAREASWLADLRIVRGGCLIEGRERIVDGRIDTALERVYRLMTRTDAT